MICPECGALVMAAIACDLTTHELLFGVECPNCGKRIEWEEWIDPEEKGNADESQTQLSH